MFRHPEDVRLLWHAGFYDGPLSGLAIIGGRRCWFECCHPVDLNGHRLYALYPLAPDELEFEEERHRLFQEHVGTHTDYVYDDDGKRSRLHGAVKGGPADWKPFYESPIATEVRDYTDREPLGHFMLLPSVHRRQRSLRYFARRQGVHVPAYSPTCPAALFKNTDPVLM